MVSRHQASPSAVVDRIYGATLRSGSRYLPGRREDLLLAYRCFKEARNSSAHAGRVANGIAERAYMNARDEVLSGLGARGRQLSLPRLIQSQEVGAVTLQDVQALWAIMLSSAAPLAADLAVTAGGRSCSHQSLEGSSTRSGCCLERHDEKTAADHSNEHRCWITSPQRPRGALRLPESGTHGDLIGGVGGGRRWSPPPVAALQQQFIIAAGAAVDGVRSSSSDGGGGCWRGPPGRGGAVKGGRELLRLMHAPPPLPLARRRPEEGQHHTTTHSSSAAVPSSSVVVVVTTTTTTVRSH